MPRPSNYFNSEVPELHDKPNITVASDAIFDNEEIILGLPEFVKATVSGKNLIVEPITRDSTSIKRIKTYEGLTYFFIAPSNHTKGDITHIIVNEIDKSTTIPLIGETAMTAGELSVAICNDSGTFTMATYKIASDSSIVKEIETKIANSIDAIKTKYVDVSGDTMTGDLNMTGHNVTFKNGTHKTGSISQDSSGNIVVKNDTHTLMIHPDGTVVSDVYGNLYGTKHKPSKADVGLSAVNNWSATNSVSDSSDTKYATTSAVKSAYDRASSGITKADDAKKVADTANTKATNAQNTANARMLKADADKLYRTKADNIYNTGIIINGHLVEVVG